MWQLGGYAMWGVISSWFDRKLIDDWRQAFRLHILQLHIAMTAVAAVIYNMAKSYPSLAQDVISKLPPELFKPVVVNILLAAWLLLGAYARLVPQPKKDC